MLPSSSSTMFGSALYFESETQQAMADVNYSTRQLQTHTFTHFDLEAVCALNAATHSCKA
jgi:hypothetical protein